MNDTLETLPAPVDVDKLDTAKPLAVIFAPYQTTLEKWEAKVASLVVTDISQKTEMAQARLARLELKDARVEMDKTRKGLVEHLKARTGKIDATARFIRLKIEDLEAKLLESEEFAIRHAAKLKAELKIARETELAPLIDAQIMGDLSDLSAENYAKMLADAKLLRQAKIDAAAKAEADRKASEEAERVERERIRAENTRLMAEAKETARLAEIERKRIEEERAEERRKAKEEAARLAEVARLENAEALAKAKIESDRLAEIAAKERKRIEAKAKADAAEAAKARAELRAKEEAEAKEEARMEAERHAVDKAAREAESAPDKAKLQAFAAVVRRLPIPALSNATMVAKLAEQTEEFAVWIEAQISRL